MEAWGYVVAVAVGVIISEGIRWFRDWRQGEEKYRLMLYEKRLEAHQKAFSYVQPLSLRLTTSYFSFVYGMDDKIALDRESHDKEIKRLLLELSNFYDSTCLYLNEESRIEIMRAIVMTGISFEDFSDENLKAAMNQLLKAKEAIVSGIGMKHIEEPKKEQMESKA